jgi:hypothetical protein
VVYFCPKTMAEDLTVVEQINEFQIRERQLMIDWHRTLPELADMRRAYLRKGIHFQWRDGQMWYSQAGLDLLKTYIGPNEDFEEKKETALQQAITRQLPLRYPLSEDVVAVDRIWANPRLIQCRDVNNATVSVRVRTNKNFRKGMRINLATQCVKVYSPGSHIVRTYEFQDPCPRLPGRW